MSEPNQPIPVAPLPPEKGAVAVPDARDTMRSEDSSTQALSDALKSSFVIIKIIMVIMVAAFFASGFFTVGSQEKAIVLRFGKPISEDASALLGPGAHFAFPYPIDEVVKIPVGEVQTVSSSVGWYFTTPKMEAARSEPSSGNTLNPARDGYLLTGDGNIVHARGTLRFRITEPGIRYSLDFVKASNLVQNAFDNSLLYASARSAVEITRDTTAFREKVNLRLSQLIDEQKLGITIDQVSVQIIPPRQLMADFERVLEAEVKRSTAINDARKFENETISMAQAMAKARQSTAEAERQGMVDAIAADANRFAEILPEYRKNPKLYLDLRYADALQRILPGVSEKFVVQERADSKPRELRLLLTREPQQPKAAAPVKTDERNH